MTKKRYIKLLYALMQKMYQAGDRNIRWGRVLKSALNAKPFPNDFGLKSYQEIWDGPLALLRKQYGM